MCKKHIFLVALISALNFQIYHAKALLFTQPSVDPNRIATMGWSHGGWTSLKALRTELTFKNSQGRFNKGIAFYPYCTKPRIS